jgi:hypothetical protein
MPLNLDKPAFLDQDNFFLEISEIDNDLNQIVLKEVQKQKSINLSPYNKS